MGEVRYSSPSNIINLFSSVILLSDLTASTDYSLLSLEHDTKTANNKSKAILYTLITIYLLLIKNNFNQKNHI